MKFNINKDFRWELQFELPFWKNREKQITVNLDPYIIGFGIGFMVGVLMMVYGMK